MAEIEMVIDSIRASLQSSQRVVILKEKGGERYLPCWIGPAEADAIAVKIQGVSLPRPLTHDFVYSVISALGGSVKSAIIDNLENDTYYAKVILESGGKQIKIDCRPSDALAVAIRTNAPLFAEEKVLSEAGILPEEEVRERYAEAAYSRKVEKFSGPVREIFALAEEQARRLNSKYIETSHLLLALIEKAPSTATDILASLGVNLADLLSAVKFSIGEQPKIGDEKLKPSLRTAIFKAKHYFREEQPSELNKLALNENAKRAIRLGVEEVTTPDTQQVLPEHLLIGIIREDKGGAGKILRGLGIDADKIHAELIHFYNRATNNQPPQQNLSD